MADALLSLESRACKECGEHKPAAGFYRANLPRCRDCMNRRRRYRLEMRAKGLPVDGLVPPRPGHRRCSVCKTERPEHEFRSARGRDGRRHLRAECRDCEGVKNRLYIKKRYRAQREFILARNQTWRDENREKVRDAQKAYKPTPEARKATCDRYRAKRANAEGVYSGEDVARLLQLQERRCFYCGEYLKLYHVDHFVPLSRGGSNWPDNIVVSCGPCNITKHTAMPWEWKPDRFSPGCSPR